MSMENLLEMINELAEGEKVEGVVIGENLDLYEDGDDVPDYIGRVLTLEEAELIIDFPFENDFGLPGGFPLTVWTEKKVIFTKEYDGYVRMVAVPRHPVDHNPTWR